MRTLLALAGFSLSLAVADAANFPYIRLNGKTNVVSDNGTNLTYNGSALSGGAPTYTTITNAMSWSGNTNNVIGGDGREQVSIWRNSPLGTAILGAGMTNLFIGNGVAPADQLVFGGISQVSTGLSDATDSTAVNFTVEAAGTNTWLTPISIGVFDNGYTGGNCQALYLDIEGYSDPSPLLSALYTGNGTYGFHVDISAPVSQGLGQSTAIAGYNLGNHENNFGLIGYAEAYKSTNKTSVGVSGVVQNFQGVTPKLVGVYGEVSDPLDQTNPTWESAVFLADSRNSGIPLFVGRTNNGTRVFVVGNDGALSAGSTNAWKLGAVKTCTGLTMIVTNYIEVVINGTTNAIPLGTITP